MLHLIFFLLGVGSLVSLERLLLLHFLLHFDLLTLDLSGDVALLLFLHLPGLRDNVVDTFAEFIFKLFDMALILVVSVFLLTFADSKLSLETVDGLSVPLFSSLVSLLPSVYVIFDFGVFFFDFLKLSLNFSIPLKPVVSFDVGGRV